MTGRYLALTGERVAQAGGLAVGLATHAVKSAAMHAVVDELIAGEPVETVLARHRHEPGPSRLMAERQTVDSCFAGPDVRAILAALDEAGRGGSAFAARIAAVMRTKSPTSLVLTLEQLRHGIALGFEDAMRLEFRIASRVVRGRDFYEGVRAAIIDKDHAPRWHPPRIEDVSPQDIAAHFAPLGGDELALP
jgi:enoyl-CoA hydratase